MKKNKPRTKEEREANWKGTWKNILEKPDGSIDKEQLKKELMDFSDMIDRMTSLTYEISRGRLSYPTYPVSTIMFVAKEVEEERYQEQQKEDLQDGLCSMCHREFDDDEIIERSEPDSTRNQS